MSWLFHTWPTLSAHKWSFPTDWRLLKSHWAVVKPRLLENRAATNVVVTEVAEGVEAATSSATKSVMPRRHAHSWMEWHHVYILFHETYCCRVFFPSHFPSSSFLALILAIIH
jgi:hypothetical protein